MLDEGEWATHYHRSHACTKCNTVFDAAVGGRGNPLVRFGVERVQQHLIVGARVGVQCVVDLAVLGGTPVVQEGGVGGSEGVGLSVAGGKGCGDRILVSGSA